MKQSILIFSIVFLLLGCSTKKPTFIQEKNIAYAPLENSEILLPGRKCFIPDKNTTNKALLVIQNYISTHTYINKYTVSQENVYDKILNEYKNQIRVNVVGYENGAEKFLCFFFTLSFDNDSNDIEWKNNIQIIDDGGPYIWQVEYSIDKKTIITILHNGAA